MLGELLINAIKDKNLEEVTRIIEQPEFNVNAQNRTGSTALHIASEYGHTEIVNLLLSKGAIVNRVDYICHMAALHLASKNGHTEVVKLLLSNSGAISAIVNLPCTLPIRVSTIVNGLIVGKFTALHSASMGGHTEICKLLINNGADVNILCTLRINKDADVNVQNTDRVTALHYASANGHTEVCKLLILNGADVNVQNVDGFTALTIASTNGHTEICKLLILNDADVNIQNNSGFTALNHAHPVLQSIMLQTLENFQNSYASFEQALTNDGINTWDAIDNTIVRYAVYNKYLKSKNIKYQFSSNDIKTNLGCSVDSTIGTNPIVKDIFSKEMQIYTDKCLTFSEVLQPDAQHHHSCESLATITDSKDIMALIGSYLLPDDF